MAVNIYRISTEYVWWKVETAQDISEPQTTAYVACLPDPEALPGVSDWVSATIISPDNPTFGDGQNWWIRLLVGPDGELDLSGEESYPKDFQSWVRINDNPEKPVRKPGIITVM